jgi:hypothetical protein
VSTKNITSSRIGFSSLYRASARSNPSLRSSYYPEKINHKHKTFISVSSHIIEDKGYGEELKTERPAELFPYSSRIHKKKG